MINRETDYAVRTVLCLAKRESTDGGASISTADLAGQIGVPYRFLRKIVFKLATCGVLQSRRGKGGGLALARAPKDISLFDLLCIMEPDAVILNQCMSSDVPACSRKEYCGLHGVLGRIQDGLHGQLASVTVTDMVATELGAMPVG
ncbi:MAG: RrF2 family transcriptional regulator [Kiritimatiellia bacterium]